MHPRCSCVHRLTRIFPRPPRVRSKQMVQWPKLGLFIQEKNLAKYGREMSSLSWCVNSLHLYVVQKLFFNMETINQSIGFLNPAAYCMHRSASASASPVAGCLCVPCNLTDNGESLDKWSSINIYPAGAICKTCIRTLPIPFQIGEPRARHHLYGSRFVAIC